MSVEKLVIVNLMHGIDNFQKSVHKNFHQKRDSSQYHLSYCIKEDTIHQHLGKNCIDCGNSEEKYLSFSIQDFKKLEIYFKSSFYEKFCEILDDWPQRNNFPNKINSRISELPEHEKLLKYYEIWDSLKVNEKYVQIDKLLSLQKELENTLNHLEELKLKL